MEMSFREKSAWISLMLIVLVFGPYFWLVGRSFAGQTHVHGGTQFALILLFVVPSRSSCTSRLPSSHHATVRHRATSATISSTCGRRVAFYVLFGGALISIFTLHFPVNVDAVAVRALLDCGSRARQIRQSDRLLPPGLLRWAGARSQQDS